MIEPHDDEENSKQSMLSALIDRKKKRDLEELAEEQTKSKVNTWKSNTNR